ncbi:hypothetical protein K474DRAFT_1714322, partial [Panus rudis PR-1116 ss-1]
MAEINLVDDFRTVDPTKMSMIIQTVRILAAKARERHEVLRIMNFENNWALIEMVHQYVLNTRATGYRNGTLQPPNGRKMRKLNNMPAAQARDLVDVLLQAKEKPKAKAKKAYKKVENRVIPVSTTLPEDYRIVRHGPENPLATLTSLPTHPPEFTPGDRYTEERRRSYPIDPEGFLEPEELRLAEYIVRLHEKTFAWTEEER